ncbi:hypothetical protein BgiMline_014494 [Biomphalaria glabrata]|nr:hypothetical protein BgiMline_013259 [Biomphalaria glabrata]KAI8773433.1 hypothetical protein BgiBS90_025851 [Biomphalaria glabrata]
MKIDSYNLNIQLIVHTQISIDLADGLNLESQVPYHTLALDRHFHPEHSPTRLLPLLPDISMRPGERTVVVQYGVL